MKQTIILLVFLNICTESVAGNEQMTPFLSAQILKENLNSKDKFKFASALSYVGGVADYLMKDGSICPQREPLLLRRP